MATDLPAAIHRWEARLSDVSQRVGAIPSDADGRFTQLIEGGRFREPDFDDALRDLDAQVTLLEDELDQAWTELTATFEQAMSRADLAQDPEEVRRLRWQRASERRRVEALRRSFEAAARRIEVEARADAARALHKLAVQEWSLPQSCSGCARELRVGAIFQTCDFKCPACGARSRVEPGPATRAYLDDSRVGALAEEAVLDDLVALEEARRRYTGWMHPLDEDYAAFEEVAKTTWTRWAEAFAPLHPAWDEANARRESARRIDETLGPWRSDAARERRGLLSRGVALVRSGNQRDVMELANAQQRGAVRLLEDLANCLHEHEDRGGAWQCLALLHHLSRMTEDRDTWMRRRIAELDEALRTR